MIYILSWTTKKHQKNSFLATTFKVEENSRTFQPKMEFKDFSRLCKRCISKKVYSYGFWPKKIYILRICAGKIITDQLQSE